MTKKIFLVISFILLFFGVNAFADDGWYQPFKNIFTGTEYEIVVQADYMRDNGVIRDLHKKLGLRLNYRFKKTDFVLTGGVVEPYLQADLIDGKTQRSIATAKVKTYYLGCKYILWEDPKYYGGRICVGVGIAQERFRWNSGGGDRFNASQLSFHSNKIMPFVSVGGELKTSNHTAISVEVWRYFGRTDFPLDRPESGRYFFRQGKTQVMFFFVFKIS